METVLAVIEVPGCHNYPNYGALRQGFSVGGDRGQRYDQDVGLTETSRAINSQTIITDLVVVVVVVVVVTITRLSPISRRGTGGGAW